MRRYLRKADLRHLAFISSSPSSTGASPERTLPSTKFLDWAASLMGLYLRGTDAPKAKWGSDRDRASGLSCSPLPCCPLPWGLCQPPQHPHHQHPPPSSHQPLVSSGLLSFVFPPSPETSPRSMLVGGWGGEQCLLGLHLVWTQKPVVHAWTSAKSSWIPGCGKGT